MMLPILFLQVLSHLDVPVHVISYHSGNILKNFYDILGEPHKSMDIIPKILVNRSLTAGEMDGLLEINRIFKDVDLARYISKILKQDYHNLTPNIPSPEEIEHIEKHLSKIRPYYEDFTSDAQRRIVDILFVNTLKAKKETEEDLLSRENYHKDKGVVYLTALKKVCADFEQEKKCAINNRDAPTRG